MRGIQRQREGRGRGSLRELRECRASGAPYFDGVDISVYDVFQVRCEGRAVGGWSAAWHAHALCDVEDDAGEAVLVEVDLLMVGYLPDSAWIISFSRQEGV